MSCTKCGGTAKYVCGKCMQTGYCGTRCQMDDWSTHCDMCLSDAVGGRVTHDEMAKSIALVNKDLIDILEPNAPIKTDLFGYSPISIVVRKAASRDGKRVYYGDRTHEGNIPVFIVSTTARITEDVKAIVKEVYSKMMSDWKLESKLPTHPINIPVVIESASTYLNMAISSENIYLIKLLCAMVRVHK